MLTPREKANDLVDQYRMILMDEDTDCGNEILCTLIAIKNAHIAVDEIEFYRKQIEDEYDEDLYHAYGQEEYWNQVKKELESL
jgi:hypothetical protein